MTSQDLPTPAQWNRASIQTRFIFVQLMDFVWEEASTLIFYGQLLCVNRGAIGAKEDLDFVKTLDRWQRYLVLTGFNLQMGRDL